MAVKGNVTGGVVKYLRKNILDGTWKVGERIPSENELCRELGVSRVSVRNALRQLGSLGILQSIHGKGTFLISDKLTASRASHEDTEEGTSDTLLEELEKVLEFRSFIEPTVCQVVAQKATDELVNRLSDILEEMRANIGNSRAFVEADMRFHMAICNAAGNPILSNVMSESFNRRLESHYKLNVTIGYYGGLYYHGMIVEAIRKRDGKRAKQVMLEHLQRGMEDLEL